MKLAIIFALTLVSTGVFAKGQVFCKDYNGKIINVLSEDGYDCQSQLYSGEVCFTGNVREAVAVLTSDEVSNIFDGTDGEYIKKVKVKNADTITYVAVDDANEWSSDVTIKRCLGSFFRN